MRAILLAGYRAGLGLERDASGDLIVDRRIAELSRLGFEVVCVLSGPDTDEVLRLSRALTGVEFVFDTNGEEANLATNLKAGLAATEGEGCFTIPVEIRPPDHAVWNFLREEWRKQGFHTSTSIFQAVSALGAPWHFGFPLLVSRNGNGLIRKLTGLTSLTDTRLKYLHLAYSDDQALAPAPNSL